MLNWILYLLLTFEFKKATKSEGDIKNLLVGITNVLIAFFSTSFHTRTLFESEKTFLIDLQ
jgi:hypothetical protein